MVNVFVEARVEFSTVLKWMPHRLNCIGREGMAYLEHRSTGTGWIGEADLQHGHPEHHIAGMIFSLRKSTESRTEYFLLVMFILIGNTVFSHICILYRSCLLIILLIWWVEGDNKRLCTNEEGHWSNYSFLEEESLLYICVFHRLFHIIFSMVSWEGMLASGDP